MVVANASRTPPHGRFEFQWPSPPAKSSWLGASEQSRSRWTKALLIAHPELRAIVDDLCRALVTVQRTGTSVAMLLLGESGSGKTTLWREFSRQIAAFYGREDPEVTVVPALPFEVPTVCTPNQFCIELLTELGDPDPDSRSRRTLLKATSGLINDCDVRVVLLDNTQDIPSKRGARGVEQVGVRIRSLIDETRTLWVFLGTARATEVVDSETQLIKRIAYRARLHYFSIETHANGARFRKLLASLDEWLPLAERNSALLQEICGSIYLACGGVLDRLVKLLDRAWAYAFEDPREHLIKEDLLRAFREVHGPDIPNPFAADFKIRYLNEKNEPFEHLHDGRKPRNAGKVVRLRSSRPGG